MGQMLPPHDTLIAWLDTETTGLDPQDGDLLEIAVAITDGTLEEVCAPLQIVIRPESADWREKMQAGDGFVWSMHSDNGLIDAIEAGEGLDLDTADRAVASYLRSVSGGRPLLLGGNSITFDRKWLEAKAPATFEALHYRSIDMTSVWLFLSRFVGVDTGKGASSSTAHRALDDLRVSIATAKANRDAILALLG